MKGQDKTTDHLTQTTTMAKNHNIAVLRGQAMVFPRATMSLLLALYFTYIPISLAIPFHHLIVPLLSNPITPKLLHTTSVPNAPKLPCHACFTTPHSLYHKHFSSPNFVYSFKCLLLLNSSPLPSCLSLLNSFSALYFTHLPPCASPLYDPLNYPFLSNASILHPCFFLNSQSRVSLHPSPLKAQKFLTSYTPI